MTDDQFESFLQREARDYNAPPPVPRDAMWARIDADRRARGSVATSHGERAHRWLMVGAAIAAMLLVGIGIGYVWRGSMDSQLVAEGTSHARDSANRQLAGVGGESTSGRDSSLPGAGRDDTGANESSSQGEWIPLVPEQRLAVTPPTARGTRPSAAQPMTRPTQPTQRSSSNVGAATNRESIAYAAITAEHLGRVETLLTSYRAEADSGKVDPQITSWAGDLLGTTRLLLDSPGASDPRLHKLLGDLEMVLSQITQLSAEHGSTNDELQLIDQSLRSHDVMTRIRGATPAGAGALPIGT